jgi:hypothetical protein
VSYFSPARQPPGRQPELSKRLSYAPTLLNSVPASARCVAGFLVQYRIRRWPRTCAHHHLLPLNHQTSPGHTPSCLLVRNLCRYLGASLRPRPPSAIRIAARRSCWPSSRPRLKHYSAQKANYCDNDDDWSATAITDCHVHPSVSLCVMPLHARRCRASRCQASNCGPRQYWSERRG